MGVTLIYYISYRTLSVQRATRLSAGLELRRLRSRPWWASAHLRPAALPAQLSPRWQGLRRFSGANGTAGKADEAAGLTPGNEDNAAGGLSGPEKPYCPLYTEGMFCRDLPPEGRPGFGAR